MTIDYLIIGAGPTGLGAAHALQEAGADWLMLEASDRFGGLAASIVDPKGFTWDIGGHVQFSHYDVFDRFMDQALGKEGWIDHERESWIHMKRRWIPYPFQYNLHRLDPADRERCLYGLEQAVENAEGGGRKAEDGGLPEGLGSPLRSEMEGDGGRKAEDGRRRTEDGGQVHRNRDTHYSSPITHHSTTFADWMLRTFGEGIVDLFMRPYNYKVWAYPAEQMDWNWIGERVAIPDLEKVRHSIETGEDLKSWGPNNTFRFPRQGGTGAIWQALGRQLPDDRIQLNATMKAIDVDSRIVTTISGQRIAYRHAISTIPLDVLMDICGIPEGDESAALKYSSTHVVGVGLKGQPPDSLKTKCWMYFPEANSPYYRVTVFSNYSPHNVPRPGEQWSLMTETSESTHKTDQRLRNRDELAKWTVDALLLDGLIPDPGSIESTFYHYEKRGYPTPFLGRDRLVDKMIKALEIRDVYSRGRFGAWKYEVANQDHSFMQGWECAQRLLCSGGDEMEPTLHRPAWVNAGGGRRAEGGGQRTEGREG